MKFIITTVFGLLSFVLNAQEGIWKPFKMLVIQPDTAIIENSFDAQKDSVEAEHLRSYYSQIKRVEEFINFSDYPKDQEKTYKESQQRAKREMEFAKSHEKEAKAFKYYETISEYSAGVYTYYFNEYEPFSTILQVPKGCTEIKCLRQLSDSAKADYIVFFKNIHSIAKEGLPLLKLTTYLYSRDDNRIILTKETEGNSDSLGDMWTCNMNIPLSCLLINGVKTSTDAVAEVLRKRQLKAKK